MRRHIISLLTFIALTNLLHSSDILLDEIISKTNEEFEKVSDFQAKMTVSLDVPGLRMPKKEYRAYYKRPNKFKATTKGFGVLPNTGLFTSPKDNFDNLKDMNINQDQTKTRTNQIMISGTLITDSLKAKFPNEYAKLSFNPIVDVLVDTTKWLIISVTSRIDTLKLFQINNDYELYENKYYLPSTSKVEYFIKDMKLANWLKDDIPSMIGADQQLARGRDIVKGMITVKYSDYLINKNLPDYIFKKKRID
tara:strand:+ start:411 stop:1163 length:753 start_codon:yes stop_codon:yes gene_type:complete